HAQGVVSVLRHLRDPRAVLEEGRMAATEKTHRRERGLGAQLHHSPRDGIRMDLLFRRLGEERGRRMPGLAMRRHEMVAPETQHADQLGRERVVESIGDVRAGPQLAHLLEQRRCGVGAHGYVLGSPWELTCTVLPGGAVICAWCSWPRKL